MGPFRLALLVALASAPFAFAEGQPAPARVSQLRIIEVRQPDGQILSYRHLAGSTEVHLRGTARAPDARLKLKIGSRPGFVELDINSGEIVGLKPAHRLGKDFLTYVLWAVSVDGKASNLGEITFDGAKAVSINVTTPYQTFWLMVTAEPNYAVVDPSPQIVLYSVKQTSVSDHRALPIAGDLFYFTHYAKYDSTPGESSGVPTQLLQARKAVELASRFGVLAADQSKSAGLKEEEYSRKALAQATTFLDRAEAAYEKDPNDREVVQFARTAAQSAEDARALAMGAVGGLLVRQLETEVAGLRDEIARLRSATTGDKGGGPAAAPSTRVPLAVTLVKQPALWFAVAGWALAIVLLFRRRAL